jgi:hypothetical protein
LAIASLIISACSSHDTPSKVFAYKENNPEILKLVENLDEFECQLQKNSSVGTQKVLNCNYTTTDNKAGDIVVSARFNEYTNNFGYIALHKQEDGKFVLEAGDPIKPTSANYAKNHINDLNESVENIVLKINHAVKLSTPVFARQYRVNKASSENIKNGQLVINYYQFQTKENGNEIHHFKDENTGQALKVHLSKIFNNTSPEVITIPTSILKYIKIPQLSHKNKWVESNFTLDSRVIPIQDFKNVNIHDNTNLVYLSSIEKDNKNNTTIEKFETLRYGLDINIDKLTFEDNQTIKFEPNFIYTNINIKNNDKKSLGKKPDLSKDEYHHTIKLKAGQTAIVSLPTNENIKRFITFSLFSQ